MRSSIRIAFASLAFAVALPAAAAPTTVQFVLISFDGAHDVAQWERSRALARRTGARFTYFLSCVFLLSPDTRNAYQAPRRTPGRSNVGFAQSQQEVAARLGEIWAAHGEGHEIASHGCGHFDGGGWSAAEWRSEFDSFARILRDAYSINAIIGEPSGWREFSHDAVKGFRAPYLSAGKGLYAALEAAGFAYDASGVSRGPAEPVLQGTLARFALPQIAEGPRGRKVVAMDYNLYVRHSAGMEEPEAAKAFEDRAYAAFMASFDAERGGSRRPLQIGFHFTLMNGGAYWRALERFAATACTMPDVACATYSDFLAARRKTAASAAPAGG